MKTALLFTFILSILVAIAPYIIGYCNYTLAGETICFLMDTMPEWGSDGDISNILSVHFFNIDAFDKPTFSDYYHSGLKTALNVFNW